MTDRRHLRPVGPDERMPHPGSYAVVLEDLEVAHGHVIEAEAEAALCPGDTDEVLRCLTQANDAITRAVAAVHFARGR